MTEKSILLEKKEVTVDLPSYTEEEKKYLKELQKRLEFSKLEREKPREEFDGLTYSQYWAECEKGANTYLKPKKDKKEIRFQSGTLRQKMMSFVSSLLALNLKPDITAFDEYDNEAGELATAMEDIIEKTEELEGDEEKKILRIYELLKCGDVFLEELWNEKSGNEKEFTGEWDGKFRSKNWKVSEEEYQGCAERTIIHPLSVYLGSLEEYFIEKQPYVFTVNTISYEKARLLYGDWENFKYVSRKKREWSNEDTSERMIFGAWQLQDRPDGEVEVIKYQDVLNNEYQIILNSIPMLPIGMPLKWGRRYNIVQQHFEPIRHNFAYGKSFIFRNKNIVYLMDEMIKMALLKTWKSFMPPYLNTGNRVISESVFMPGKISMGILPNTLVPVSDKEVQGVTNGEFAMIQDIKNFIDQNTASQTFTGQTEKGQVTATQIIELQRQSRIMMGIVIASASLLEKKLAQIRADTIMQNWFLPIDQKVDKIRDVLKNVYRIVSRKRMIESEGMGRRYVIPTEEMMEGEQIMAEEERMKQEKGYPVRMILINPNEVKTAKYIWQFAINPKEKKSSEMSKLLFGEMIAQGTNLGLRFNPEYIQQEFAEVWDKDPNKLFLTTEIPMPQIEGMPETQEMMGVEKKKPTINQMQQQVNEPQLV
jgi:hypothetical protein